MPNCFWKHLEKYEGFVNPTIYPTDKGTACIVNFIPVKTKALRLEVVLPADNSTGVFEWIVK